MGYHIKTLQRKSSLQLYMTLQFFAVAIGDRIRQISIRERDYKTILLNIGYHIKTLKRK